MILKDISVLGDFWVLCQLPLTVGHQCEKWPGSALSTGGETFSSDTRGSIIYTMKQIQTELFSVAVAARVEYNQRFIWTVWVQTVQMHISHTVGE